MSILHETYRLSNGVEIPKVGFGTWQIPDGDETYNAVTWALEAGYVHIDTAQGYRNERSVGRAVRDYGIAREKVFITTKVQAEFKDYDQAKRSIEESLERLDLRYIDLLLIHAPRPWNSMGQLDDKRYFEENAQVWRAMEEAYQQGTVKAIGVSNFQIDDLQELAKRSDVMPMANQIRLFIGYMQEKLVQYCKDKDILVEAYSPFATGRLLDNKQLQEIADRKGVSIPQLSMRYLLDKGTLPLPKSVHKEYIKANTKLDFELAEEEIRELDQLKLDI